MQKHVLPVTTYDDIDVKIVENSGAIMNEDNGQCTWEFSLTLNAINILELQYEVKYLKWRELMVE